MFPRRARLIAIALLVLVGFAAAVLLRPGKSDTGVAADARAPESASRGELRIGYLPDGLELVGDRVNSNEHDAQVPHVSSVFMYDDPASTGNGTHGAERQLNLNVMVGAFPADYYDWLATQRGAERVQVRGPGLVRVDE